MKQRLEYTPVWLLANLLRWTPRPVARALCIALALLIYRCHARLRRAGMRNLDLAFPKKDGQEKKRILRGLFVNLGRQLAEFCLFPRYTKKNSPRIAVYDGFQNFADALARGKGVVFLTAHLGGWELSSFVHSLNGYPMNIVVRPLDNPYVNAMVDRYRTLHGNRTFHKQDFARGLLTALRRGEVVGVLMDTNMTPPQGAFVDFFGVPACTATGIARVALHTDAAVVPAFGVWDKQIGKYRICFEPALRLVRTADSQSDILANTALFTKAIEAFVARYPEQ
ncbi:MAG: lysophospholipid acyltransferase family protein, partial [Candidatus Angelobacter sp.]